MSVANLGLGAPGLPLILGKKEEMTEEIKAGWASKIEPGPLLIPKSVSATECIDLWKTLCHQIFDCPEP